MKENNVDFHIHTERIGCADETMKVPDIIETCAKLGLEAIAITDHLNTLDRLPDHKLIKKDIAGLTNKVDLDVFFAVELNFTGKDRYFAYSEDVRDELGFQFAIGGIHSAYGAEDEPEEALEIQHRHHLWTCKDPLVSVLVHPYWFGKKSLKKMTWFEDMSILPDHYITELASASLNTGTAIEINANAIFLSASYSDKFKESYIEYLKALRDRGAIFTISTDAHKISVLENISTAQEIVRELNIASDQLWYPSCEPFKRLNK